MYAPMLYYPLADIKYKIQHTLTHIHVYKIIVLTRQQDNKNAIRRLTAIVTILIMTDVILTLVKCDYHFMFRQK